MNLNQTLNNGTQIFTDFHRFFLYLCSSVLIRLQFKKSVFICVYLCPILLLSACGQASGVEAPTPTPLPTPVAVEKPTYTVQQGTVARALTVTGRVAPVAEQRLFFRSDGFVRDVFVARDALVQAGDALAELEIGRLEDEMAQAQLAVQTAETNLARAVQGNQDALAEAQIQLEIAEIRLQRASRQTIFDRQIAEQEILLIELRLAQLERGVDPLLALDVERAMLSIERLERQIADARLIAPFSGQIVSVNLRPGAYAEAFRPVIVLADPSALEITVEVGATELRELSVGTPVTVQLRNRPGAALLNGSIRQLPLTGTAVGAPQQEDRLTRIVLDDETVALELGELATLTIILEEREDVLWLPPAAIRLFQGRSFVVVQDGDVQRRIDVRLGIQSDDRVEILEGLAPGQIVVGP